MADCFLGAIAEGGHSVPSRLARVVRTIVRICPEDFPPENPLFKSSIEATKRSSVAA
jgi:hypothetical protein